MNRTERLLGLSKRAGKLQSGEFCVEKSIKSGRACLVIAASDASHNTVKKFTNMCSFRKVPFLTYSTKEELGSCIGEELRSVVALEDPGFADTVMKTIENETAAQQIR